MARGAPGDRWRRRGRRRLALRDDAGQASGSPMPLLALLFDVDGTLAETEEGHREAFNNMFIEAGLPWLWDQAHYRDLLRVTGGKERLLHHARLKDPERLAAVEARLEALHKAKNARFAQWMKASGGALRPGVRRLIDEAKAAQLRLAVVTTTSRANLKRCWPPRSAARHYST